MNPVKIQGKFYPLQHQEWLRACRELTKAEIEVLYYLRTLDPRDNGVEVSAAAIARDLSTPEKIVHRQTVSRALKRLDALGFIDIEPLVVKVNVKPKGYWCSADLEEPSNEEQLSEEAAAVCGDTSGVWRHQRYVETPQGAVTHHNGSPDTIVDRHAPEAIATHQPKAESLTQSESENPKINKNYLDFIRSLSEEERENFEKFVRDEWRRCKGEEIVSLERFLAKEEDLKNWHQRFLDSPAGRSAKKRAIATSYNWRDDARFDTWIWEAFNRGFEWLNENESEREQRKAFYDWAFAVNAFDGVCL